jgi:HTH-type transcriptional regulator / antitoxin MqsA
MNAAIVSPGFIAAVRKRLDLDQREAAELFVSGVNAFSRYANGKSKPPLALGKLFKLPDRSPDLLNEVRAACGRMRERRAAWIQSWLFKCKTWPSIRV